MIHSKQGLRKFSQSSGAGWLFRVEMRGSHIQSIIGRRLHGFGRSSHFQPVAIPGEGCKLAVLPKVEVSHLIRKRDLVGAT